MVLMGLVASATILEIIALMISLQVASALVSKIILAMPLAIAILVFIMVLRFFITDGLPAIRQSRDRVEKENIKRFWYKFWA